MLVCMWWGFLVFVLGEGEERDTKCTINSISQVLPQLLHNTGRKRTQPVDKPNDSKYFNKTLLKGRDHMGRNIGFNKTT